MKKKLTFILIIIIALVFAVSLKKIRADSIPTIAMPAIFRDNSNGVTLSIQLTNNQPDTGQFDLFIPQNGYYRGILKLKGRINCEKQEDCDEDEDDRRDPSKAIHFQDKITVQFYPLDDSAPVVAKLRVEGKINSTTNNAIIHVWIDKQHYRLKTKKGDPAVAAQVATQSLQDTTSQNWTDLYGLLSTQIQAAMTQDEFTQMMSGTDSPTITAATLNGAGNIFTASGDSYFAQPVTLTVQQPDGTTKIFKSTQYFVLEQDAWRFLSTDTPSLP